MFSLRPHTSNHLGLPAPRCSVAIDSKNLKVLFELDPYVEPFTDKKFAQEYRNWGLWEYDVFEIFLTRNEGGLPYLEAQASPLDQNFALLVEKPRKEFDYPESLPFSFQSSVSEGMWRSEFEIPLSNIPGEGAVRGNLHAIIGPQRGHFSLSPNLEGEPDFHRPDLFMDFSTLVEREPK